MEGHDEILCFCVDPDDIVEVFIFGGFELEMDFF